MLRTQENKVIRYYLSRSETTIMVNMDYNKLLQDHTIKEKEVMRFFNEAVRDFQVSFLAEGCERFISVRTQAIIAFTFAEVLSNFWDCYTEGKKGPEARMTEWFNTFCELDKNPIYKDNLYFKELGIKPLLDLRHSLIHFFGLSPQKIGKEITLISSNIDNQTFEKYKMGFGSRKIAVLKPVDFFNLFREGGLLMLNKMLDNVSISNKDEAVKRIHVEGVNRIFEKFRTEGAMQIKIPKP